jgi:hypothetical protein
LLSGPLLACRDGSGPDSNFIGEAPGTPTETLEHGGEYPDMMPQAIRLTDAKGRSAIYVPVTEDGKVVDSKGFDSVQF